MNRQKWKTLLPLLLGGVFACCFILLIILVRTVDVSAIGPGGTSIGLSHINGAFRDLTGINETWYKITKWLGLLAIAAAAGVALLGLIQWITRKSLVRVDRRLFALGGLYLLTIGFYFFFELVVVCTRPVLLEGDLVPAASFPSSHTLLACVVFGSAFWLIAAYLRRRAFKIVASVTCGVLLAITVFGRVLSGVHWLTDILGGVLLSAALICFFAAADNALKKK